MREWKLKTKYKHRPLERGIPLSQCDVEDILVALEARNEQWSISTTGWNKLVMNDAGCFPSLSLLRLLRLLRLSLLPLTLKPFRRLRTPGRVHE